MGTVFSKYSYSLIHYKKPEKHNNTHVLPNIHIKKFRIQEEFGPKKFIKPWRTGTKSQQQIPPRGQKKGFRG